MLVPDAGQRLRSLSTQLNLIKEQQSGIKTILEEEYDQVKVIRGDTALTIPERRAKLEKVRDVTAEKIKPLLTEEQLQKYAKLREQAKERRTNRPAPAPKPQAQ